MPPSRASRRETARSDDLRIALTTAPASVAKRIARTLVTERRIACANLVRGVASVYRWKGKVETAAETLMVMKTTARGVRDLRSRLAELHPYDVPEFVVLRGESATPEYLAWLRESVR